MFIELIEKKLDSGNVSIGLEIENRLSLLAHELLVLHNLRKKCIPIEGLKESELPNYCVVKNKEYCFLSGKCKECLEEPKETFLSKTCTNDWESNAYCPNENKCQMCVSKTK